MITREESLGLVRTRLRHGVCVELEEQADAILFADGHLYGSWRYDSDYPCLSEDQIILRLRKEVYPRSGVADRATMAGMYRRERNASRPYLNSTGHGRKRTAMGAIHGAGWRYEVFGTSQMNPAVPPVWLREAGLDDPTHVDDCTSFEFTWSTGDIMNGRYER